MKQIILNKQDYERIYKCVIDAKQVRTIQASEADKLLQELKSAKLMDAKNIPADVVTMNSIVKLELANKKTMQVKIVYPWDANLKEQRMSIFSPIATALLGYQVGDEIEWAVPGGMMRVKISEIVYQPEAAGDFES